MVASIEVEIALLPVIENPRAGVEVAGVIANEIQFHQVFAGSRCGGFGRDGLGEEPDRVPRLGAPLPLPSSTELEPLGRR
jgi:hypothetical protein